MNWDHEKKVILTIGPKLYEWEEIIEEIQEQIDKQGELSAIDNFQSHIIESNELFLIVIDDNQVVGSEADRRVNEKIFELKRK